MRKFLLVLSMASILLGPMLYFSVVEQMSGKNGFDTVEIPELKMPQLDVPQWIESVTELAPEGDSDAGVQVYKWQDEAGVWQYSNEYPLGVAQVETVLITSNSSVQAVTPKAEEADVETEFVSQSPTDEALDLTLSPARIQKLIQDARNVQTLVDEHAQQMEGVRAE